MMNNAERFKHLTDHFNSLRYTESFTISRVNYNWLLVSHNKYLKLQLEHEALKREMKKNKRLDGIESVIHRMGVR